MSIDILFFYEFISMILPWENVKLYQSIFKVYTFRLFLNDNLFHSFNKCLPGYSCSFADNTTEKPFKYHKMLYRDISRIL